MAHGQAEPVSHGVDTGGCGRGATRGPGMRARDSTWPGCEPQHGQRRARARGDPRPRGGSPGSEAEGVATVWVQATRESKTTYHACMHVIDLDFRGVGWRIWIGLTLTDWLKHSFVVLGKPQQPA